MSRVEKTVFISYRRTNFSWAYCIYQNLTHHGYDVFFDYQKIDSGSFENAILENIKAKAHFILVLSPSALERCRQPDDWLRREIETAMDEKRNIIPIMLEGFDFGSPSVKQALTGKLAALSGINAMSLVPEYVDAGFEKLRNRFLNIPLQDVRLHTLPEAAREITAAQKMAADEAPPVEKDELNAQTWFERGYVFAVETKNPEEAMRCFSEAIRLDPNLDAAYSNLGLLLHENFKRYDDAEVNYRKAIEINPSYATDYSNLGNLLSDQHFKRYDEAEAAYRKAIEINPSDDNAYSNLGALLGDLKRYDEAKAAFRKAIELNPAYDTAYYNLGNLLSDQHFKRYDDAEAAYRKAIEINPAFTEAYYNLGLLLHEKLKRYDDAEAAFHKAIELNEASPSGDNPAYDTAYNNLGLLLHEKLKRYDDAEATYRKAIEINPANNKAYNNLGSLLDDLKRYDEAEVNYRKAIEINPADDTAYSNLGILLRVMNKEKEALPILEKLVEINPENFNSYLGIASIKKALGEPIEASLVEKARKFIPEDDLYNRACLESVCDNFDLAFEYLQKAAQKDEFPAKWAWEDPDLQWLRNDPRFVEIVGEKPE